MADKTILRQGFLFVIYIIRKILSTKETLSTAPVAGISFHDNTESPATYYYYGALYIFVLTLGPTEQLPDYNRIRGSMYWLRI